MTFKKLIFIILQALSLTASPAFCTQTDSLHPVVLWRYRLLVRDAMIKLKQDTIIKELESKVTIIEQKAIEQERNFNTLLSLQSDRLQNQTDLTTSAVYMKEYYEKLGKRFKTQRNVATVVLIVVVSVVVLKPP